MANSIVSIGCRFTGIPNFANVGLPPQQDWVCEGNRLEVRAKGIKKDYNRQEQKCSGIIVPESANVKAHAEEALFGTVWVYSVTPPLRQCA